MYRAHDQIVQNTKHELKTVFNQLTKKMEELNIGQDQGDQSKSKVLLLLTKELEKSMQDKGLPIDTYNSCLSGITGRKFSENADLRDLITISRKSAELFRHINTTFSNFLTSYPKNPKLWETSKAIFSEYEKYVRSLQQQGESLSITDLSKLFHYTYRYFLDYTNYSGEMSAFLSTENVSWNLHEKFNLEEYSCDSLIELCLKSDGVEIDSKKYFNTSSYKKLGMLIKCATLDIRQELLLEIEKKSQQDEIIIDQHALRSFINELTDMNNKLKDSNFDFETESRTWQFNSCGEEVRIKHTIATINENIYSLKEILNGSVSHPVSFLFNTIFWIRYELEIGIDEYISTIVTEIVDDLKRNRNASKGSKVLRKLQKNLDTASNFLSVYKQECSPILNTIENFDEQILKRKTQEVNKTSQSSPLLESPQKTNETSPKQRHKFELTTKKEEKEEDSILQTTQDYSEVSDGTKTALNSEEKAIKKEVDSSSLPKSNKRTNKSKKLEKKEKKTPPQAAQKQANEVDFFKKAEIAKNEISQIQKKKRQEGFNSIHNVKCQDLVQEVIDAGYEFLRQKGSHAHYINRETNSQTTIPIHNKRPVNPKVVKSVRNEIQGNS